MSATEHSRRLEEGFEQFFRLIQMEGKQILDGIEQAEGFHVEKDNTIASLEETVRMQHEELDRVTADFQDKLDRAEQEITSLRSRLNAKDKSVGALSRAVVQMMQSARHLNAVGTYAFKLIQGDAMGDKIVTQLHGRPQRTPQPSPSEEEDSILDIIGRAEPLPPERASGR